MSSSSKLLLAAIGVWAATSVAAAALFSASPVAGLLLAALGGVALGVLSARRCDPRKVKVRRRRGASEEAV